jgi:hypothetical protein
LSSHPRQQKTIVHVNGKDQNPEAREAQGVTILPPLYPFDPLHGSFPEGPAAAIPVCHCPLDDVGGVVRSQRFGKYIKAAAPYHFLPQKPVGYGRNQNHAGPVG